MAAINFLKSGFNQAISKFRLSVYLWLLIMAISLIIIIPISSQIRANLGHLSWSEKPLMPFELNLMEIFLASQNFLASYIIFLLIAFFLIPLKLSRSKNCFFIKDKIMIN